MTEQMPKLRMLDMRPIDNNGSPAYWLRDPFELAQGHVVVPQPLMPLVVLADGTRPLTQIRAELSVHYGVTLFEEQLDEMITILDNAYLLDNARSQQAMAQALSAYRSAPQRTPSCADASYPADPAALSAMLDAWLAETDDGAAADAGAEQGQVRGILSPHIDYQRGGPVYAQVWGAAAEAAREAKLVVILGTDHYGGLGQITLTRQSYATPYGLLPTDSEMVEALAHRLGEEHVFEQELHHVREHAIELSAVWLHHVRGGEACALLPILLGSPAQFIADNREPDSDPRMAELIAFLRELVEQRGALLVASADMAHVGPAFGGQACEKQGCAALRVSDEVLLEHIAQGDAAAFWSAVQKTGDANQICGLASIYVLLKALGPANGRAQGYAQCPADAEGSSWVTIGGMTLS